ncbi:aminopeptidase P family protein [SAR202 cluster bacterium AD-804-J14_MRT_500m]|nr:aminopeptidase P family protein [SAR202 cluster bacterium AD-804-J14_MRT_500m]
MTNGTSVVIANLSRLHRLMDESHCEGLILRSGKNFTYLTGFAYPGTLARHLDFPDSPREVLLVYPRTGDPVMILNSFAAPLAERDSWLKRIEIYDSYGESPWEKAASVLKSMGLGRAKLGCEKSYLSAASWVEITGLLPKANIIDCTRLMDETRWIKTTGEIDLLIEAANLLDEAYLEVFAKVREGDTEREIHGRILESCIRRKAGWAHGILNSSRNTVPYGGEGDMVLRQGDIIRNDYVSYLRGYPGHQSRTVVLGKPSSEQKITYETVLDIYRGTIAQCQPGVRASDVYTYAAEAFKRHKFQGSPALVGHGVGPWWHQQEPYIVASSKNILEEGMVLALEPHIGYWHLQDMVLVEPGGPRLLSTRFNTDDMFVAG